MYKAVQLPAVLATLNQLVQDPQRLVRLVEVLANRGQFDNDLKKVVPDLLALNQCPDFIEDHGHTFGADLPDEQKKALIEYMKTF
jgi:RNA processing factor Prp31